MAVAGGHVKLVEVLLDQTADVNTKGDQLLFVAVNFQENHRR